MAKGPLSLNRLRNSLEYRTGVNLKLFRFTDKPEELEASDLFNRWWYYSIELLPGLITKGIYPCDLPMLPRLMLRKCDLRGSSCLDMGTMEGLIPTLMCRGGAREVVAIDAVNHCFEKLHAVQHYYGVKFSYRSVGLMYDLHEKFEGRSFDLINCSGLLYHVFSPLMLLCGVRPLLKRNGMMIVSTNVTVEDGYTMEFNNAGRMQPEANTFWYLSVKLLDYLLRYLKLAPIDALYIPHASVNSEVKYVFDKPSGHLSVLCRANDEVIAAPEDAWMAESALTSWEYLGISSDQLARQPISDIACKGEVDKAFYRTDTNTLDLWRAINEGDALQQTAQISESHVLRLTDQS
jgi:2-polyprenyl-3-methyl-5-hydroxy-6-metoxy-1,4-benzoquinol methylase